MHLSTFVLSSAALVISFYAEKYRQDDFEQTLDELEGNLGLPVTEEYDFIIGKLLHAALNVESFWVQSSYEFSQLVQAVQDVWWQTESQSNTVSCYSKLVARLHFL